MKCDGHAKITIKALKIFQKSCEIKLCSTRIFSTAQRVWTNRDKSTAFDNIGLSFFDWLLRPQSATSTELGRLTNRVVAIDLDSQYRAFHHVPEGQRYHFMRAKGETTAQAYENACMFIKQHADAWVGMTKNLVQGAEKRKKFELLPRTKLNKSIEELALALHCLQDSFSPGHTVRATKLRIGSITRYEKTNSLSPIRELLVYAEQDTSIHGEQDYQAGGPTSQYGHHAVNASVELMRLGVKSVTAKSPQLLGLGWKNFQSKWLAFKP